MTILDINYNYHYNNNNNKKKLCGLNFSNNFYCVFISLLLI